MENSFLYGHVALGDMIAVNGAVRHLASMCKKVNLVCLEKFIDHGEFMFKDLNNVHLIKVVDGSKRLIDFASEGLFDNSIISTYGGLCELFHTPAGLRKLADFNALLYVPEPVSPDVPYPDYFYDHIGLPRNIRMEKFKLDMEQGPDPLDVPYRFIHRQSTLGTKTMHFDDDMLVLDPNENYYQSEDPRYEQAKVVLNLPTIFHRIKLIKGAKELHLVESSYLMLCLHLELSHIPVKMYYNNRTLLNSGEFKISENNK